jgi:hypothetical protein
MGDKIESRRRLRDAYETLTVETGVRGSGSIFNRLIDCVF